jgi:hypothetical protein
MLARLVVISGTPWASGDVLRRLGRYVCDLADRKAAILEAEAAKKAGRAPH